jgi:hypothetical protein
MAEKQPDGNDAQPGSADDLRSLLAEIRRNLARNEKATVGEYIRLLELVREIETKSAAEIKVGWCDWLRDE